MRIRFRQLIALVVLVMITSIYLNATRILMPDSGSNYLSDFKYSGSGSALNTFFFGSRGEWGTFGAFRSLSNEYEYRKNYGLLDPATESMYQKKFAALAMAASQDWQQFQAQSLRNSAFRGVDDRYDVRAWMKGNTPAMVVAALAAVYTGRTLRYRLNNQLSLESRTEITGSNFEGQYVGWNSSALDVSGGATYDTLGKNTLLLRKRLTTEVSLSYEHQNDHSVGVVYSRGF